jgi:tripartite-type tricarboxylate transporter receptor subunit TctC
MKVMQLHPKSDAITQLHGGSPLQDRYVDIRTYHYASMTASAKVSDEVCRQARAPRPCVSQAEPEEGSMKLPRRQFLHLAAGVAALLAGSRFARAQTYPSRPVRIVVGFAAGGPNDILARLIGRWLSEQLGQQFVIENRPGAGSNIATETVVRAAPDGYTLLLVGTPNAINATLYDKLNFNFIHDIAPVGSLIRGALVMVVHPAVPAKTLPEFIAYAKANPGKLSYGSGGIGGITHITAELFKEMAGGLDILHVPYRGVTPALTDLLGGQVQVVFTNPAPLIGYIGAGALRALAITTAMRSEALPDIPTIGEFVPGYEAGSIFGLGAPKSTRAEIVDRLNGEINAALVDPKFKAQLANLDGTVLGGSPADFGKLLADETEKWAKVIRTANIKPE